jgi:hypothetical protein
MIGALSLLHALPWIVASATLGTILAMLIVAAVWLGSR